MTAPEAPPTSAASAPAPSASRPPALPLNFSTSPDAEELARAEAYGILARLWLAPPDEALLQQFKLAVTEAPQPGGHLQEPWQVLVAAMRATTVEQAALEYDSLFQGVGKADIFLYGSFYLSGFLNEKPLAQLRTDLQALGLSKDAARGETEDHIAYVFEVMRYLIAGDDGAVCNLAHQQRFYRAHVQSWVEALCDAVQAHPLAQTWVAVAAYTRAFMQIETQGFDMLEA